MGSIILVIALIFFLPFFWVIGEGGSGGVALFVGCLSVTTFITIICAIVKHTKEKKTEQEMYDNEVIEEYKYQDFIIKKIRKGDYVVEYHGETPVRNPHLTWHHPLEDGFVYGKKATIEQIYRNLKIAKKLGFYC